MRRSNLLAAIDRYAETYPTEHETVARFRALLNEEPRCYERDCWRGHITGSAWVVHPEVSSVLLTHHKKLDIWVQLGGHSDGDENTWRVAQREAEEESGLGVRLMEEAIFDLDVHEIPARKNDPAHFHFDVRFAFAAQAAAFSVSEESHALAWIGIEQLEHRTQEPSMLRMRDKWLARIAP